MLGPEIDKSALLIVDMQNDFVHPEGGFAHHARETPEAGIDMPFLMGTIPAVQRLAEAFRTAGRPVVSIAHIVKPDYSDAQFPYWRIGLHPNASRPFIVEGTWGAQIIDALQPRADEHLVMNIAPYGRTFQRQPLNQGPARGALEAYVPRLITSPSS